MSPVYVYKFVVHLLNPLLELIVPENNVFMSLFLVILISCISSSLHSVIIRFIYTLNTVG
jgi:hypothetical protein